MLGRLFGKKEPRKPMRDVAALVPGLSAPGVHAVKLDAPSRSHFGGPPNLPPGTPWPTRNGRELGFLARLSLPQIHRAHPVPWLPATGALLFFYDLDEQPWGFDPKDCGGCAVLLVPDLVDPIGAPATGPRNEQSPMHLRNAGFRKVDTFPSQDRDAASALQLSDEESDEYFKTTDAQFQSQPKHLVSGFPSPVQGDYMELEAQLVTNGIYCGDEAGYKDPRVPSLEPGVKDWRLLFQFDTDDDLGVMWGDCGTVYFWVREDDARAGSFANVWLILQCS